MFTLKIPSMLALDKYRMSNEHISNLNRLFGIEKVPSDTTMREILDEVDPDELRVGFKDVFHQLQRSKALEDFVFMDGRYLAAIDGTGYFSSDSVHCPSCMEKHQKKDGTITYHHQMLGAVEATRQNPRSRIRH